MSDANGFWKALGNFANAAAAAQRIRIPGGGGGGGQPTAGKAAPRNARIVFNGYPLAPSCRCSGKR